MVTLAVADRVWRSGQTTYANGISGLGIAILYLSFYSSFGFYHLIEPAFAFRLAGEHPASVRLTDSVCAAPPLLVALPPQPASAAAVAASAAPAAIGLHVLIIAFPLMCWCELSISAAARP